jgi:outer membrane receptor protein involved in Fe transport
MPTTREEMVSGFEAGLEVRVADFFMIGLTHFDQRTTGPVSTALGSARYTPFARNAGFLATGSGSGEITGAGWEATSSIMLGELAVNAALATVDSRIARLPAGFAIGLREGDRMPHIPAVTSGIGASWTTPRGSLSVTASRAWNWLSYDHGDHGRSDSAAPRSGEGEGRGRPGGGWISFDSGTLLDAGASFAVRPELSILWGVENLLGDRSPQPLNAAPASGRNFFLGLRATF